MPLSIHPMPLGIHPLDAYEHPPRKSTKSMLYAFRPLHPSRELTPFTRNLQRLYLPTPLNVTPSLTSRKI